MQLKTVLSLFIITIIYTAFGSKAEPTTRLMLEIGDRNIEKCLYDSALSYYRPIAGRYSSTLSREEKMECLRAIYGCCDANIYKSNYVAAYEDILLAEDVLEDNDFSDAKLNLYKSALYIILATHTKKIRYLELVETHAREAFWKAIDEKDTETAVRAFGNLANCAALHDDTLWMEKEENTLRQYAGEVDDWRPLQRLKLAEYWKALGTGDFKRAAALFEKSKDLIPASQLRALGDWHKYGAVAYASMGDYARADSNLQITIKSAYMCDNPDLRLSALSVYRMYGNTGDSLWEKRRKEYEVVYLQLRDSLQSTSIADDMVQLEYIRERRDMQRRMVEAEYRSNLLFYIVMGVGAILLITVAFVLLLRNKNKKLRLHSRLLVERMRDRYSEGIPAPAEDLPEDSKYEGSKLTESDKTEIAGRIEEVMKGDAVYSQDITLNSFASLVGRHAKAVSQVIHEKFGCNFSTLVNKARITEACRRMDSVVYRSYSIEGIAESVGFNSRTTFSTNFRRFTGLGIREYRKEISRENPRETFQESD